MYSRPLFLEELHAIREEMSRECDYDLDLFAEMVRSNQAPQRGRAVNLRGVRQYLPPVEVKVEVQAANPEQPRPPRKKK